MKDLVIDCARTLIVSLPGGVVKNIKYYLPADSIISKRKAQGLYFAGDDIATAIFFNGQNTEVAAADNIKLTLCDAAGKVIYDKMPLTSFVAQDYGVGNSNGGHYRRLNNKIICPEKSYFVSDNTDSQNFTFFFTFFIPREDA